MSIIFSRHTHTSRDQSSVYAKEANMQEDGTILLYTKEDRARGKVRIHEAAFTIDELEEIVRLAKVERNNR